MIELAMFVLAGLFLLGVIWLVAMFLIGLLSS